MSAYASNLKKLIKCYINFYPQFYQYALYFDIVFIELFFTQYSVTCRAGESYCSTAHSTGLDKKEINPVLQLKLIKSCPGPCFVKEIGLSLKGTTLLTDLTHLSLYRVAGKRGLSDWEKCVDSVAPALKTVLDTPLELKSDTTILWVTVKLKDKVDLTHRVTVSCDHVTTTCGKASVTSVRPIVALRTGVAVRQRGKTESIFRVFPALLLP